MTRVIEFIGFSAIFAPLLFILAIVLWALLVLFLALLIPLAPICGIVVAWIAADDKAISASLQKQIKELKEPTNERS